jgi:hypothetical protein
MAGVMLQQAMREEYERKSREVIDLFLNHGISYEECTAALRAAFGAVITEVTGKELIAVTIQAVRNNEAVMREMARRGEPALPSRTTFRRPATE